MSEDWLTLKPSQAGSFLPNVKDEPRPQPARRVHHSIYESIASFRLSFSSLGLALVRHRRRSARKSAATPQPTVAPPKLSGASGPHKWEDEIAAQLSRFQQRSGGPIPKETALDEPARELTEELLRRLEWKRFETLVSRYFGAVGFRSECSRVGTDGGIDAYLDQRLSLARSE